MRRLSTAAAATTRRGRWWDPHPPNQPINASLQQREQRMQEMVQSYESKFTLPPEPSTSKHIFDPTEERVPEFMDEIILPHLLLLESEGKSADEVAYLRSFLGRRCLLNHKFWDAKTWADKEVARYFSVKEKKLAWNAQVKERHKYVAMERVREGAWVFSDSRNVFSHKRRAELFGEEDVHDMSAMIFGSVARKRLGYLEIIWRVPDPKLARKMKLNLELGKTRPWWDFLPYQTVRVLHFDDLELETLWPEEYVHTEAKDEFTLPIDPLHREDWVRNLVIENRMVVFTDSMECPEYKRLIAHLGEDANVYTVALDRGKLVGLTAEETRKVRDSITNVTNYPFFPQFFLMRMFAGGMREFDRDLYRADDVEGFKLFMRLTGVVSPDYHLRAYTRYRHQLFTTFNRKWFLHERREGYAKLVPAAMKNREDSGSFMEDCYRLEREEFCEQAERVIPFLESRMQEMSNEVLGGEDRNEIPEGVPLNVLLKMVHHPYFQDLQWKLKENRRKLQKLRQREQKISVTGLEANLQEIEERELREIDEFSDEDGALERARVEEQSLDADFDEEDENFKDEEEEDRVVFRQFAPKHADKQVFRDEDLFNDVDANERYLVEWIEDEQRFATDEEYAIHLRREMNVIVRRWSPERRRDFFAGFFKLLQGKARYSAKLYNAPKTPEARSELEADRLARETQFELSALMRKVVMEERARENKNLPLKRRPTRAQLLALAEHTAKARLSAEPGGGDAIWEAVQHTNAAVARSAARKNADIDNEDTDWEGLYFTELAKGSGREDAF